MTRRPSPLTRVVRAVHGRMTIEPDPRFEIELSAALLRDHGTSGVMSLYGRFAQGREAFDYMMRRACLRALAKSLGDAVTIGPLVSIRHPETFEIGSGVYIGEQAILQGRFDGRCRIGDGSWIGPQSFLDARDLILGAKVGWGPGAKALGSMHTGSPADVPIIESDLAIDPIRVEDWADIGVNATILPGVTIGRGGIVGAGAVVTKDVAPYCKVAGVPAVVVGWRGRRMPRAQSSKQLGRAHG
jgi:acetyltransferase-like isoleucine patch superfamily enzyme